MSDPLSPLISAGIGRVLDLARRPSDAIAQYERTIDIDPSFAEVYFDLSIALRHVGRCGEALEAARRAVALAPVKPAYRSNLAVSCLRDTQCDQGDATLAQRNLSRGSCRQTVNCAEMSACTCSVVDKCNHHVHR